MPTTPCAHLLAVDGDGSMQSELNSHLAEIGAAVTWVHDLSSARLLLRLHDFDLVLLGTALRDGSGLDLLADIHGRPSLVVSADDSSARLLDAFDRGADDCVTTPYRPLEVVARIKAALHRVQGEPPSDRIEVGDLRIDLAAQRVTVDGTPVELTAREFALFAYLATHAGRAFTREELLRSVWRSSGDWQSSSTITEHVRRVRHKLLAAGGEDVLHTIRGVGYRFDQEPESDAEVRRDLGMVRAS